MKTLRPGTQTGTQTGTHGGLLVLIGFCPVVFVEELDGVSVFRLYRNSESVQRNIVVKLLNSCNVSVLPAELEMDHVNSLTVFLFPVNN